LGVAIWILQNACVIFHWCIAVCHVFGEFCSWYSRTLCFADKHQKGRRKIVHINRLEGSATSSLAELKAESPNGMITTAGGSWGHMAALVTYQRDRCRFKPDLAHHWVLKVHHRNTILPYTFVDPTRVNDVTTRPQARKFS